MSDRYIPADQRMAAFASMLLPQAERDELRARKACATEVLARFEMHHIEYFSWGGSNRWHNLDPQLKADHKRRTKTDIGIIAKSKRIQKKQAVHKMAFMEKAALKKDGTPFRGTMAWPVKVKRKIASRPFPKRKVNEESLIGVFQHWPEPARSGATAAAVKSWRKARKKAKRKLRKK